MFVPSGVYHPREPESSPLWKLLSEHFNSFVNNYKEKFEKKYGYFREVVNHVVEEYLSCGDLKKGFARVKCPDCKHEYLLAYSCKSRWLCPSCQAKKVIQFGDHLKNNVLFPVPHRQWVFSIPIMLRVYFKNDRKLLSKLCHCAYKSLLFFLRETTGLKDGVVGAITVIHTFGDFPDKFHPHLHIIATDGLFSQTKTFYVMRKVDLKPLEELFRALIFKMLKKEGKINQDLINKLLKWKHSGFNIHNGVRIEKDDEKGRESIAQYIMRNTFSINKINYNEKNGSIIYHSKMKKGKNKNNFEIYTPEEFIAAITQHIPERSFHMTRYYGYYSNKSRGLRAKEEKLNEEINKSSDDTDSKKNIIKVLDISDYKPKKEPSLEWRECIKKIYEVDPLKCPDCESKMKIIGFINEFRIVKKILEYLDIYEEENSRDPPIEILENELVYELVYDDW